jgi:hypothetical protein
MQQTNNPRAPKRRPGIALSVGNQMPDAKNKLSCPHCGEALRPFEVPEQTNWGREVQWACFNDDCSYYKDGWDWMWEQYSVKASYRYRVTDPQTGKSSPLAVWSQTACLDRIINDEEAK